VISLNLATPFIPQFEGAREGLGDEVREGALFKYDEKTYHRVQVGIRDTVVED